LLVVGDRGQKQGITYSIMSASWDDDREGSLLGTEEFSQNVENIKTGLSRSRENAILRDKMDIGMYTQEDLDQTTKS
jgi:Photosynthesis affected mutant 68